MNAPPAHPRKTDRLAGLFLGLVATVVALLFVALLYGAVDVTSGWVSRQQSLPLSALSVLAALALPGVLTAFAARSGSTAAVLLSLPPAVFGVFATLPLVARGPLGDALRSTGGVTAVRVVAALGFCASAAGGCAGMLLGRPKGR